MSKKFYCPEHQYNPPANSGFALCPHCEAGDLKELPPHLQLEVLRLLARVCAKAGPLVDAADLHEARFTDADIAKVVAVGWLTKTPGRWSTTYQAGTEVREQMLIDYVSEEARP